MKSLDPAKIKHVTDRAEQLLKQLPDIQLAFVYGSMATGTASACSDLDLAVLFTHSLNAKDKMELSADVTAATVTTVDLVDLYSLRGTLLRQILVKGKLLVKNNPDSLQQLMHRMIYNEADMMPYIKRSLLERQQRFSHHG